MNGLGQGDTVSTANSAVVAEVASSNQAMRRDHHPDTGAIDRSLEDAGLWSRIATPLIANDRVVGALHLSSSKANTYGSSELARLKIVGNQIAGAIASGILLQAERDRATELKSLYEVAAIIARPLSFEAKAQKIVDELVLIAELDHVVLRRLDENQKSLLLVASAGSKSMESQRSLKITATNSTTLEAHRTGSPILIGHYSQYHDAQPDLIAQGVESMYFMPISLGGRSIGSLSLASRSANHFKDTHLALIAAFSNEIGTLFNLEDQETRLWESQIELENLWRDLKWSNTALESHYLVSQVFNESGVFRDKAKMALEKLIVLTDADWAIFRMEKPTEPGLHLAAAAGPAVEDFPPIPVLSEAHTISTAAFTESRVIVTDDYPSIPAASQFLINMGMESLVFLPVRAGERTIGLVTVISKKKSAFDPEVIERLNFVVERLGVVVENALFHDESEKAHREMQQLAEALSYSNEQINESNQQLEERVQVRTQELEAARERAMRSEKLAMIGQLSGGIVHDLRNPLGAIKNAAYLAKRKFGRERSAEEDVKIAELLDLIDGDVARAEDVISNLLSFGNDKEIVLSKTNIGDVINHSMSSFVLNEGIDLTVTMEPGLPLVLGDDSHLIRTLQNLVANAQDAMEDGGRLSISALAKDGSVEIVVSDTGGGIAPENLERIFDPLYSGKSNGTGLGLAICHEVISKHHGSISVESEIGVGTSFTICIPFADEDDARSERSVAD